MTRGRDTLRSDGLALCIVCDIRSFTGMQTRVHDLVFESVQHSEKDAQIISMAYKEYVKDTQNLAHLQLTKPLRSGIFRQTDYVVKSTGDGYLISIPIQAEEGIIPKNVVKGIIKLIGAAYLLARDSELESKDTAQRKFAEFTLNFLNSHGDCIGFNLDNVKNEPKRRPEDERRNLPRNTRFRVAVGVSLGFGTFIVPQVAAARKAILSRDVMARLRDVSGYGVNLAFRLCDHAGRGYDSSDNRCTPPVLLDRRIGRVLLENPSRACSFWIVPWDEPLRLNGIDEGWAYYLKPKS